MSNLKVSIDVTKLDKTAFYPGKNGAKYASIILWENDEPDQYGNTHAAKQDMGKERRGEKTPYVGNAKPFGQQSSAPAQAPPQRQSTPGQNQQEVDDDSDIPF